jgi:hypothetical protein
MKISTKMLAVTAAIGIIGLAGFSRLASANQGQSAIPSPSFSSLPNSSITTSRGKSVTTLSQNQKTAGVKDDDSKADGQNEKEDGDGETNDDRK